MGKVLKFPIGEWPEEDFDGMRARDPEHAALTTELERIWRKVIATRPRPRLPKPDPHAPIAPRGDDSAS